ncbi:Stress responsive A/B Barrel Domain protein [Caballeronia hypogeia]|uniref:Stress responsive A/B Barrel Domain protein n=1 Tax=Caballeronia hypogeia TaxID=1777140 RepID=A0A158AFI0_9BURK|nr:Dabb family protein [Caballeronia hypogeia]SAK56376.1 Stress responsive A/B Barrel Domain protein [Caballeronia hypogeia]
MMKHIVMFKRLAHVEHHAGREAELVAWMRRLDCEIPFIREWRVSANELDRPICWDYVLESSFDDRDAVERYLPHPKHVELIQALKTYFEWVACDYTVAN